MDSLFPLTLSLTLSDPKLTVMAGDVTKQAGVCVCVTERGRERECEKESTRKTARDKAGGMDGTKEGGGAGGVTACKKYSSRIRTHTLSLSLTLSCTDVHAVFEEEVPLHRCRAWTPYMHT